jgi:NAD+ kinase
MKIQKAGIVLKKGSERPRQIAEELVKWFADQGIETVLEQVTDDLDILVTLGGDGTLLQVADKASKYEIPVMGINLGGLGFLTAVAEDNRIEALTSLLEGTVSIEQRMILKTRLYKQSADMAEPTEYHYALNDVVISKGGLIFSTPTGSTAYNLSAGGPIVQPNLPSLLVTPICPFMLESRPVLLTPNAKLLTKLVSKVNDVKVIVDGRFIWEMKENFQLEVEVAEKPLLLISSLQKGYFEILRNKLNWGGSESNK